MGRTEVAAVGALKNNFLCPPRALLYDPTVHNRRFRMNLVKNHSCTVLLALIAALAVMLSVACHALTAAQPVPAAYVRDHPEEWSVKVRKMENGLIQFTIVRFLKEPKYLVAHLVLNHSARVIAESDSPAFGRKGENTFYFSISPDDLAESRFDLSESFMKGSGDRAIPIPGTVIHQFRVLDFVTEEILKSVPNK